MSRCPVLTVLSHHPRCVPSASMVSVACPLWCTGGGPWFSPWLAPVVQAPFLPTLAHPLCSYGTGAEVQLKLLVLHASLCSSGTHHGAAMELLVSLGVIPVVSTGSKGKDSSKRSPARSLHYISVANSDVHHTLWRSSSRGRCVDVIARTLGAPFLLAPMRPDWFVLFLAPPTRKTLGVPPTPSAPVY